jgi:predicted ATPase
LRIFLNLITTEINFEEKLYIHFNNFMMQLHHSLHKIRYENKDNNDELIEAIKSILKNNYSLVMCSFLC